MGATSITGKGNGIAGNLKGPANNRNYFVPAVGPHIVAAGRVTLPTAASVRIDVPAEADTWSTTDTTLLANYACVVSTEGAGYVKGVIAAVDANGDATYDAVSITITETGGSTTDTVNYMLVRVRNARENLV